MPPAQPLPLPTRFATADAYIASLLRFSTDPLFRTLCGGVHILDFFARDPPHDLYRRILPPEWTAYFDRVETWDVLKVLMYLPPEEMGDDVPKSLRDFAVEVRAHSLRREFTRRKKEPPTGALSPQEERKVKEEKDMEWSLHAGMKPKKIHEVSNFAAYVDDLVSDISKSQSPEQPPESATASPKGITHILDYGSGQAYLIRVLAKKYGHSVVGIEGRANNVAASESLDQKFDSLSQRRGIPRRGQIQYVQKLVEGGDLSGVVDAIQGAVSEVAIPGENTPTKADEAEETEADKSEGCADGACEDDSCVDGAGDVASALQGSEDKRLLLISLHSCGNLVHHALRAFITTPSVRAVALIGCCYNLLTESLTLTHKPPFASLLSLRENPNHPRLVTTSSNLDPAGFPISGLYRENGVSLNITARSMACQASYNWTVEKSRLFFKRHYFRALLQRLLLDKGLVHGGGGVDGAHGEPVILGSLRKGAYESFPAYVRGAVEKLGWQGQMGWGEAGGEAWREAAELEAREYDARFAARRKEIEIVWSLMAFTAGVVESLVVVDRWVFLREELGEGKAWVEPVFEYSESPRNLVVVGVR